MEYDLGRQVTAYVPAAPPEAVVFAGDGLLIASWGGVLEAVDLPPTLIIGAHRLDDETLRLQEYSPGESTSAFAFDPERFAAHEKFFVEDVRRWAQSRFDVALPADRTGVFGVSASGELALAMGLRHPDIYGVVFCASPGAGYGPPAAMPTSLPRTYLVAGTLEPFFLQNATRWAVALRDAGGDVVMAQRVGSHGDAFWRAELPLMVAWASDAERRTRRRVDNIRVRLTIVLRAPAEPVQATVALSTRTQDDHLTADVQVTVRMRVSKAHSDPLGCLRPLLGAQQR